MVWGLHSLRHLNHHEVGRQRLAAGGPYLLHCQCQVKYLRSLPFPLLPDGGEAWGLKRQRLFTLCGDDARDGDWLAARLEDLFNEWGPLDIAYIKRHGGRFALNVWRDRP